MTKDILTVSQLNRYLKFLLDENQLLKRLTVQGEISNFTNHVRSGHFYFTLKDAGGAIRCVMFKSYAQKLRFEPENGMKVLLTGSVRFFERDGNCQFYCEQMEPDGIGALALAFEQLKDKLEKEGLFAPERKKPLPPFPKRIGVVTSKTGAALQDIINILSRRYPIGTLTLIPALVQGEEAPLSLCQGIALAQTQPDIDLLIVGRGGGSLEDLWAFNDEQVARAIADCTIPVISAVGHEVDFTIADFVADLRAPTPSAAAELAVPDLSGLEFTLTQEKEQLYELLMRQIDRLETQFLSLEKRLESVSPVQRVVLGQEQLEKLSLRLENRIHQQYTEKEKNYLTTVGMLEALNPLKVLTRGYSITYKEEKIVNRKEQVTEGDIIKTMVSDGEIYSRICKKDEV